MSRSHALTELTVEHETAPIAVGTSRPRFGWKLVDSDHAQIGYRIIVERNGASVWDSGDVDEPGGVDVVYSGAPLRSDTDYEVRVQGMTSIGKTPWVSTVFSTSILDKTEWTARWLVPVQEPTVRENYTIGDVVDGTAGSPLPVQDRLRPPQRVRQSFFHDGQVVRARLYSTSRGIHRLSINGEELDDTVLDPGWESYHHRLPFVCHDVLDLIRTGENVVGMTIADGWWAGRVGITGSSAPYGDTLSGLWLLSMDTADGRRILVRSGDSPARSARGPWDYADLFIGERFDARRLSSDWSAPGFDDSAWAVADARALTSGDHLVPFTGEPVRRTAVLPTSVISDGADGIVLDVGQVIAGRLRLVVEAEAGAEIVLEHCEVLDTDGAFFQNIFGPNKEQRDIFVCAGTGPERYEPSFTFHGFRYVRLASDAAFSLTSAEAVVLGSDLTITAGFSASDPFLSRFHENVLWSQRGNFLAIPTDCPQRERAGWTGDLQVFIPAAATNMEVRPFVERWLASVRAEQFEDGGVPVVVPSIPSMDVPKNPIQSAAGWSDAIALVPWTLWERYGDREALAANFSAMRRYVDYQWAQARAHLPERLNDTPLDARSETNHRRMWNSGWQFGDWLAPSSLAEGGDPQDQARPRLLGELTAAMFHARTTAVVARAAEVLGRPDEARSLDARAASIRRAFAEEYIDDDGRLPLHRQGPYTLALAFDLVPGHLRSRALAHLVDLIEPEAKLDTGFLSTPFLLDVLWESGHGELALRVLRQMSPPSWLYAVTMGATTIWESWDAVGPDGTPTASSLNHYALGCIDDWLFRRLAGIQPVSPGYADVRIEPYTRGWLDELGAWVNTVRGQIEVEWTRDGTARVLQVTVPSAVRAVLVLDGTERVLRSGRSRFVLAD